MIEAAAIVILSIIAVVGLLLAGMAFEDENDRIAAIVGGIGIASFLSVIGLLVL